MSRVEPLANGFVKVCESPDPQVVGTYSPGLAVAPTGRIVATTDWGSSAPELITGVRLERKHIGRVFQGKAYTSDDHGATWTHRVDFPFMHARPFYSGDALYVLGQAGDLMVIRSDDNGETWSDAVKLSDGQRWHQAPSNVYYANGCVYLVMERRTAAKCKGWNISENAPVLMRAKLGDDLTQRENWTFASELAFCESVPDRELEWFGVPFWPAWYPETCVTAPGRGCAPIGWLETNVVQFTDPDHLWHDSAGHTFHLWMRAHTGGTGLACIAKVVENDDGSMTTSFETAPSGKKMLYVPCPGGQMKFHILHDEPTALFWLLSTQATDSMCRPDRLGPDRYNLPNNQRDRLQLHFSKNCIDWCFAGLVTVGSGDKCSRSYASMAIDGDDLHVLSRSGDEHAKNAHDVNFISFHTVKNFRNLAY
jgi:hypothetical protein